MNTAMTKEERKLRIQYAYKQIANSSVHKEMKERLMFLKGWSAAEIRGKLQKVAAYVIDNPDADLGKVYAGAFGFGYKGSVPEDVTK
jgi:hypothetical protein